MTVLQPRPTAATKLRASQPRRVRWLSVALSTLAAGCAVGPDFQTAPAPGVSGYTAEPLPAETAAAAVAGGEAQRFLQGSDISAQWWTLFRSPALNTLVERSLK